MTKNASSLKEIFRRIDRAWGLQKADRARIKEALRFWEFMDAKAVKGKIFVVKNADGSIETESPFADLMAEREGE